MTQTLDILTCGHEPTPRQWGSSVSAPGHVTFESGVTKCYPCADDYQRDMIRLFPTVPWGGYIHKDDFSRYTVTTWTGGFLARVTFHTSSRTGFYGAWVHRWWARTPDGRDWYGQNGGDEMSVIMRPINRKAKPQPYVFIPPSFPVKPLNDWRDAVGIDPSDLGWCGTCGLGWNDSIPTEYTPAPSARCPFEAFHI